MVEHEGNVTEPAPSPSGGGLAEWLHGVDLWLHAPENQLLVRLLGTALLAILAWAAVKLTERALTRSARRYARLRQLDEYQTKVIVGRTKPMRLIVALLVMVVGVITLLGIWGLQTAFTGLLAGAGFAGIVIGMAAGDTIGDVIAGFLIFYNHPFDIGDWVEIDGLHGYVEDVALGATTLLTFDNEKITIPNRLVESTKVKNFTHSRRLRRRLVVGVEYGTRLGLAMQTLVDLAKQHPDIMQEPEPQAVTIGFGPSSVDLELRYWVEPVRSSVIKTYTDMLHSVHDTFRRKGLAIAFPHMQIVQGRAWQISEDGTAKPVGSDPGRPDAPATVDLGAPRHPDLPVAGRASQSGGSET